MSPPFNELSDAELDTHAEAIRSWGAEIVWVGLGMPKQELWMAGDRSRLPGVNLVGVGAAFDWLAGTRREWHLSGCAIGDSNGPIGLLSSRPDVEAIRLQQPGFPGVTCAAMAGEFGKRVD